MDGRDRSGELGSTLSILFYLSPFNHQSIRPSDSNSLEHHAGRQQYIMKQVFFNTTFFKTLTFTEVCDLEQTYCFAYPAFGGHAGLVTNY